MTTARFGCLQLPTGRHAICSTPTMVISLFHFFWHCRSEYSCSLVGNSRSRNGRFVGITRGRRDIYLLISCSYRYRVPSRSHWPGSPPCIHWRVRYRSPSRFSASAIEPAGAAELLQANIGPQRGPPNGFVYSPLCRNRRYHWRWVRV